jgi:hypothetical protein
MHARIAIGFTLLFAAAAQSTEPAAHAPVSARPAATGPAPAAPRPPLKLGIGDVRKYMMPNDYRAAVNAPDADKSTIVVEGEREAPPLKSKQPLPQGLGAVFSLFRNPGGAWRLFIPDPNAPELGPPDPVPAREFRWGP